MDVEQIELDSSDHYGSAMIKLQLPSDLVPSGRHWQLSDSEYHDMVARELGKCAKFVPMSARVTRPREIILMPADGVSVEEALENAKKILKPLLGT